MDIDVPASYLNGNAKAEHAGDGGLVGGLQPRKLINLENLVFDQGNHLMTNPKVKLPQGSTKRTFKGYEEIHVRPQRSVTSLVIAIFLLLRCQNGLVYHSAPLRNSTKSSPNAFQQAFNDDGNMLICAPTGSGKTNVGMLTILREIGKNRNPETGEINLDAFKIVYIAPLKALVQEQVGNFGARLKEYGIQVSELTGDRQLTKQQIADTQIIVTTPENGMLSREKLLT
jgi:pre-mRNA-splicing helicase BRR2